MLFRLLLPFFILAVLALAACSGSDDGCALNESPAAPELLSVVQDPGGRQVTATIRDESDNEQWFALERAYISTYNKTGVVGTSVELPDREAAPINEETGRVVEIKGRLLFEGETIERDAVLVYSVRAWNCYYLSEPSNSVELHVMAPGES